MSECILAEPDALGDGSTDSIYLRDKIFSRSDGMTGRPERSKRRVVCLGFGNSRCDGSRGGQIGFGPGRSVAESAEDSVRVISVVKREFAELDALSNLSTDAIYLEDQIVSRFIRAMGHPGWRDRHIKALRFKNPRGSRCLGS